MKVLTAYNKQHEKFLWECTQSVPDGFEHVIQYDEGRGKAWAMNKMLSKVKRYEIIVVCDADDRLMPIDNELIYKMQDCDLLYGNAYEMDEQGNVTLRRSRDFDLDLFKKINFIPYSGVMMWGWLAKSAEYPDVFHGNDWLYWHRLYQNSQKFMYSGCVHSQRRTWTSYKRSNIPVYRKLRRLYYDFSIKQQIKKLYD